MTDVTNGDSSWLDPQLGPFYMEHGDEFIPLGFEDSLERLADCMGQYSVRSNFTTLNGMRLIIGHYDLTQYIQEEWDKFSDLDNPPRRGFFIASRSASAAAGRAAEEVVLRKILWRCHFGDLTVGRCLSFWQAFDEGKVSRPRGVASDDIILELSDGSIVAVESKSSFKGSAPFNRFKSKAVAQLMATTTSNPSIAHVILAFVDLQAHTILLITMDRSSLLSEGLDAVELAFAGIDQSTDSNSTGGMGVENWPALD